MNSALRLSASRLSTSTTSRSLSTKTDHQAVNKLRSVLEDYRQQHYTQEIPSRFKKEIVLAASSQAKKGSSSASSSPISSSSVVAMDGLRRVLFNIGAHDRLEMAELQAIFREVGDEGSQTIPAQRFYQIL